MIDLVFRTSPVLSVFLISAAATAEVIAVPIGVSGCDPSSGVVEVACAAVAVQPFFFTV